MYGAKLEAHTSRPYKMTDSHWSNGDMTLELLGGEHLFQFIQWEDEEPYSIAELIEEYEEDYKGSWEHAIKFSKEMRSESEETEVKNIEWVKKEIENMPYTRFKREGMEDYISISKSDVLEYLDQLDEPEVLSQKWIDEHRTMGIYKDGNGRLMSYFALEDLQNLLVPKQEEVDQAYKDGYETGKQHTLYKGYLEGLEDKGSEPETVADVVTTFWKSYERLKEVMSMEVEELE